MSLKQIDIAYIDLYKFLQAIKHVSKTIYIRGRGFNNSLMADGIATEMEATVERGELDETDTIKRLIHNCRDPHHRLRPSW